MVVNRSSIIASDFIHGTALLMGDFNLIEENVQVGDNVTIKNYVELRKGTIIGDDCYIDSRVSTSGGATCVIGNNVTIRYGAIIARNVIIEDDVFISPQVGFINIPFTDKEKKNTVIGEGTKIGFNATIMDGVSIAKGTIIGAKANVTKDILVPGIYVGNPARLLKPRHDPMIKLGLNVEIEKGAIIGGHPYLFAENGERITPGAGVVLGDHVWVGALAIIMKGRYEDTQIGNDVKIAQFCNIGHDVILEDKVRLSAGVTIGGHAKIGRRTLVGMGAIIRNRVTIGKCSLIGMGSNVVSDIPDNVIAYGNPCRVISKRFKAMHYYLRSVF